MEENTAVLETPEVVKHTGAEWYRDVSLEDAEVFIRSNLQSAVRSVIATGFYLKHIRDNELYLEAGYKNVNEYAMDRFGLSASATSRYITRNTRFSRGGNSPLIDDRFKDFSKSQLQEMLGMSDEQLEQVTPDMTVREIRSMARPKEVPYIEIPGQTELKDIPGVMPEERAESFEASTAELFGVEEGEPEAVENVVQPMAGKPISQEIPVAELMEEEDAEIATSQPQDSMTIRKFIKAWKEYQLDDFKRAMRAMRTGQNIGEKAKQIQKELAPYGCHCVGRSEYSFDFHSFAGGMDWRVRNEKIHLKYGRLASELLCMYDPWSSEFDEEPDIIDEQRNEPIDAAEKQQMGHCLHRPEYECSLPEEYMHRPGSGMDCAHECCWECAIHGACKLECNSSANRPEVEEGQHWPKTCITGKSKYGNCNCCGANGVKCCAECKEDCNCRCGWLDETEEEIATSQTDNEASEDEVKERTDIELLRELLERKKQLLSKCLGIPGIDKSDEHIRMQKLEVGALASMLCELEDLEEKKDRPKQLELPQLKNNDQRAAFIDAYETWTLWIDNQETGERYYRYDLPDGTSFVIKTYHSMLYDWKADVAMRYKEGYGANEEYLLESGKFFRDCRTNRTTLIEKLKEIQKGERQ